MYEDYWQIMEKENLINTEWNEPFNHTSLFMNDPPRRGELNDLLNLYNKILILNGNPTADKLKSSLTVLKGMLPGRQMTFSLILQITSKRSSSVASIPFMKSKNSPLFFLSTFLLSSGYFLRDPKWNFVSTKIFFHSLRFSTH